MNKYFYVFSILLLTGCARPVILNSLEYIPPETLTIQVEPDENSTYWWGPLKIDLEKTIIEGIKEELRKSAVYVVNKNADVIVVLTDILTGGETGRVQIEKVDLSVKVKQENIFQVVYKQKAIKFPDDWYRVWAYTRNPKSIAVVLTRAIIRELGVKRLERETNPPENIRTRRQRGYIIYQPKKEEKIMKKARSLAVLTG